MKAIRTTEFGAGFMFNVIVTLFHLVHLGHTPFYRLRVSVFGEPWYSIVEILAKLQFLPLVVVFWFVFSVIEERI